MYSPQDGHGHWRPVWDSIYLWSSLSCGVGNRYTNLTQYAINSIIAYSPVHGKGGVLFCVIASRYTDGRTANWCGLTRQTKCSWVSIQGADWDASNCSNMKMSLTRTLLHHHVHIIVKRDIHYLHTAIY